MSKLHVPDFPAVKIEELANTPGAGDTTTYIHYELVGSNSALLQKGVIKRIQCQSKRKQRPEN